VISSLRNQIAHLASGDDQQAEAAVHVLAALAEKDPSEALAPLQELLASNEADNRWWATRALSAISLPQIPDLLLPVLDDPDPAVRQCAALGLRFHPSLQAIPRLVEALSDPDLLARDLAAGALEAIGEAAVPALIVVIQTTAWPARCLAARALARIGDPRAIPTLYAALDDDSALMEYWAAEGLERLGVGMLLFTPG
jgi:HEAT repeat protein